MEIFNKLGDKSSRKLCIRVSPDSSHSSDMTLSRNIFRPWDGPVVKAATGNSGGDRHVKRGTPERKPAISPAKPTSSFTQSKVSGNGSERHQPKSLADIPPLCTSFPRPRLASYDPCTPSSHFSEPESPAEGSFPFHSDSPSSLFLYPLEINELANLSRNELTAIGLLPPEPSSSLKTKRQRPKRFHCPHCQVAFSNNGQLRGHIRIHTGERPFVCEHEGCGKSFTRNEELTRHRRIHTGLRPFPCSICGKKFGRKDHLKKHTRTHQRVMYAPSSMIGYGNPFQPFHPPMLSNQIASDPSFSALASGPPFGIPMLPSLPQSHYPLL